MILIGQYDSPFVRRVAIAMTLYELAFEHRPLSAFGDVEELRRYNPLARVPTLVLDDGEVLIESHAMLDYLDSLVPPERALMPAAEPGRHRALKIVTLATGAGDKAASLFYEKVMHREASGAWVERCRSQILAALAALDTDRAARRGPYWFGERIGHADIAAAAVLRFIGEAHPGLVPAADLPALRDHAQRLEALPVFAAISQPFIPPA